jgi:hypothetical protein
LFHSNPFEGIKIMRLFLVFSVLALVSAGNTAHADKGQGHGPGSKGKDERSLVQSVLKEGSALITLDAGDRRIIREYLGRDYKAKCPPGLAKKRNGCLPPGLAKKYAVGRALPPYVSFLPLPDDLLGRLSPLPPGYKYGRVDGDVLLLSEAGHKVIDAVTLLSAVGN